MSEDGIRARALWLANTTDDALSYLSEVYGYPIVTDEGELHRLRRMYELAYDRGRRDAEDGIDPRPALKP